MAISNHSIMLGGGEHSFLDLLSHLSPTWKPVAVVPKEGELAAKLQKKNIETIVIPLPKLRPRFILKILSSFRNFFKACKKYRPALIYANGSRAAFYGGIVGRILSLPVVWHCRIADSDNYLDFILTRLCNHIVANSHATAKRFGTHIQTKVTVVYNGLDIQWLRENTINRPTQSNVERKIVLVVARVSRWKRHDMVLSAFTDVAKSDPNVHLVCLGAPDSSEPEWWAYLQDRTKHSAFSDRIHWVGHVDDVRPWYRIAHMLVLASENEPFGRVLVEAMACGVPIIATGSGGVPEIVRHDQDGFLVSPGKADEVADAMEGILKDEALQKRLARSAEERAQFFSLDTHMEEMLQIFQNSIRKRSDSYVKNRYEVHSG